MQTVGFDHLGTFSMTACDLLGNCSTATAEAKLAPVLTITNTVDNSLPDEGTTITYTVTVSNVGSADATGVVVSDTLAGELAHDVTLAAGATVSYTHTWTADNGPQTVVNTATVKSDQTDVVRSSVSIAIQNVAPSAQDDEVTISKDGPAQIVDVLGNDSDPGSGDVLAVTEIVTAGTRGSARSDGGIVTYDPAGQFDGLAPGEHATDVFHYTVSDGASSDTASVVVTVVNDGSGEAIPCALYPFALHVDTLSGTQPGDALTGIPAGDGAGNFGWLSWNGDPSVPALVASLTPPGNSSSYVNPNDLSDHVLSSGDWVAGKAKVSECQADTERPRRPAWLRNCDRRAGLGPCRGHGQQRELSGCRLRPHPSYRLPIAGAKPYLRRIPRKCRLSGRR